VSGQNHPKSLVFMNKETITVNDDFQEENNGNNNINLTNK
jgi:hypothetical protein